MSRQADEVYEFDEFRLEPAERVLLRGGEPVPLTPKSFETLLILVRISDSSKKAEGATSLRSRPFSLSGLCDLRDRL